MSDDLRDAIATAVTSAAFDGSTITNPWLAADAVLAMPEIVDMIALCSVVNGLTVEQVARALRAWSFRLHSNVDNWCLNDDEKALAAWREPT